MNGRVLIIAGSDSSGGAGIQADIKTVTVLGGYAMTAITALTAQNTTGVYGIQPVPTSFIRQQIDLCLEDIGADVVKIGMIGSVEIAAVIEQTLRDNPDIPVVLDPVLVATSGASLAEGDVASFIRDRLVPLATLVTPNIPEAEALTGRKLVMQSDQLRAATELMDKGAKAVLIKGGHAGGDPVQDILCSDNGFAIYENPRLNTTSTHGTGCTLASAIATRLAQGKSLEDAVADGTAYVHEAIRTALGYGKGHGPLNHGHSIK